MQKCRIFGTIFTDDVLIKKVFVQKLSYSGGKIVGRINLKLYSVCARTLCFQGQVTTPEQLSAFGSAIDFRT